VRIDLHTHSTASDGTDRPADLVRKAAAAGLDVLAITDHDTTAGWDEALGARPDGLTLLRGAELSCVYVKPEGGRTSLHLLAYLFDPAHAGLKSEREQLRSNRLGSGEEMVGRLVADGYPITWDQVLEFADGAPIGRPHVGRALVAAGVVDSVNQAFAEIIYQGSGYYVRKQNLDVFAGIRLVLEAGGIPVFAHPLASRRGRILDDEAIAELAAAGLVGIEMDHPDHDEEQRFHAQGLAKELGLIPTGSSDYHGTNKTRNPLGVCGTDPDAYAALLDRPTALRPVD